MKLIPRLYHCLSMAYQMAIELIALIDVWLMQLSSLAPPDRSKQWGYAPVVDKALFGLVPTQLGLGFGPFHAGAKCAVSGYVRIMRAYL